VLVFLALVAARKAQRGKDALLPPPAPVTENPLVRLQLAFPFSDN